MRFCAVTLGCKANQYDTGTIEGVLRGRGHEQAKLGDGCDVCIVNTCAVTAESVRKSRQAIRRAQKLEPNALIAVCGCYSELEHEAAAALGAGLIGGAKDREAFAEEIEKAVRKFYKGTASCAAFAANGGFARAKAAKVAHEAVSLSERRTRALLKIQDGCDNRCAYCIIPFARGASRSMPLQEMAEKAKELATQGYKEIVITGIEISSYQPSLLDALRAVSAAAPSTRLRLGSLRPNILTESFIGQLAEIPNLCDHFHISLQSGCDATLERMQRGYATAQIHDAIERLRGAYPNCGITADLIVGFPGETEEEFEQTLRFIEKSAFSAMHVFPFSPRPGTKAAELPEQIDKATKQRRAQLAIETAAKLNRDFKQKQVGKTLEVLFETNKGNCSIGHSRNYLTVAMAGKPGKNTLASVEILSVKDDALHGKEKSE